MSKHLSQKIVLIKDNHPARAGTVFHLTKDKTKYISSNLISYNLEEANNPELFVECTPLMSARVGDNLIHKDNIILQVINIDYPTLTVSVYNRLRNNVQSLTFKELEEKGFKLISKK